MNASFMADSAAPARVRIPPQSGRGFLMRKGDVLRVVDPQDTAKTVDYDTWGRVELTTLTKEFFMPRFLERDEALRRKPRAPYEWDGVAEVRPFGAMENKIVEGVY